MYCSVEDRAGLEEIRQVVRVRRIATRPRNDHLSWTSRCTGDHLTRTASRRAAGRWRHVHGWRERFLQAYEQRIDAQVTHPLFGYRMSCRPVLEIQARLLAPRRRRIEREQRAVSARDHAPPRLKPRLPQRQERLAGRFRVGSAARPTSSTRRSFTARGRTATASSHPILGTSGASIPLLRSSSHDSTSPRPPHRYRGTESRPAISMRASAEKMLVFECFAFVAGNAATWNNGSPACVPAQFQVFVVFVSFVVPNS